MTIEETIAYEREKAKEQRSRIGTWNEEYSKRCEEYAEEHEQLAEWLEELKANKVTSAEVYEQGYNRGYSKAIDDFVNEIKAFQDQDEPLYNILWDEIAEQLKEGGENE